MAPIPKPSQAAAPLLKGASTAPFVFFDNVPLMGSYAGNIEVELAARSMMPKPDGKIVSEPVCVAHLRCSPAVAGMLIDALQKGLALYERQQRDQAALHAASGDEMNGTTLDI